MSVVCVCVCACVSLHVVCVSVYMCATCTLIYVPFSARHCRHTCVTWRIHTCDVTHTYTHSCSWHNAFIRVTYMNSPRQSFSTYVWRGEFIYVTWHIHIRMHICDTTHGRMWHFSWWVLQHCTRFARLVWGRLRVPRAFVYSDSFVCYVCFCSPLPIRDTTHWRMWHI